MTLLVPLLLALRGSVTECLAISCDLTEGYCCSFPSLEGLVHLLKKFRGGGNVENAGINHYELDDNGSLIQFD